MAAISSRLHISSLLCSPLEGVTVHCIAFVRSTGLIVEESYSNEVPLPSRVTADATEGKRQKVKRHIVRILRIF